MKMTTLGRSGLHVSRIAFGTWQLGGDWGRFDEDAPSAAIRRARELGVNFFDTAQGYGFGASERLLGKALRDELDPQPGPARHRHQGRLAHGPRPAWSATPAPSGCARAWTPA